MIGAYLDVTIALQYTFVVPAWRELEDEGVARSVGDDVVTGYEQVDMLDETPLLDIKPYVKYFDNREDVISGWLEKHFKDG